MNRQGTFNSFPEMQDMVTASLQRGRLLKECPGYDTEQSDGEGSLMLGTCGMWYTLLLPSSRFTMVRSSST